MPRFLPYIIWRMAKFQGPISMVWSVGVVIITCFVWRVSSINRMVWIKAHFCIASENDRNMRPYATTRCCC